MSTGYSIIVVDDEAIIRDGISSVLPWGSNGFILTGLFSDGRQALDFIRDNHVDVVISDINMPKMNGLELSAYVATNYPHILVLLLTGYDEFEYAQEAVRNQVKDFLLKPITARELADVLEQVRAELDKRREWNQHRELLEKRIEESFSLLKERFLQKLVAGRIDPTDLTRQAEYFGMSESSAWYLVLAIGHPSPWKEIDQFAFEEQVAREIEDSAAYFTDSNGFLAIIIQDSRESSIEAKASSLAKELYLLASRNGIDDISIGVGIPVDDIGVLPDSYRGAVHAVRYSHVLGISQVLHSKEIRERERISVDGYGELVDELISSMREGSRGESSGALERVFIYLEEHYIRPDSAVFFLSYLYYAMVSFQKRMQIGNESFSELSTPAFDSLKQARAFFMSILEGIEDAISNRRNDLALSRIDRARAIIAERYAESGFSLRDICESLFLSVSQFSALFKEGTGKTFIEYLTAYRIERAKELLKGADLRVYEVAEQVGYVDPRYFSYVFKKSTGMTTREYQRSIDE